MSVATDFRKWLLSKPAVTQAVGDRVCQLYVQAPKDLPCVVFRRSARRDEGMDLDGDAGLDVTTLDIEVSGLKRHNLEAVADAIRDAANGFPQADLVGDDRKWNGRVIQFAAVNDAADDYDFMPPASDDVERTIALSIEVFSDG